MAETTRPAGNNWDRWKSDWGAAVRIILQPPTLVFLSLAIGFLIGSVKENNKAAAISFTILTSLTTGILGSYVATKWSEHLDRRILTVRGKLAVIYLKVLLNCIDFTQQRVSQYVNQCKKKPESAEGGYYVWLSETGEKLRYMYEQTVGCIETWSDVIPEANIRSEMSKLEELRQTTLALQSQREELEKRTLKAESEADRGIAILKAQLEETKAALTSARAAFQSERSRIADSLLSGLPQSKASVLLDLLNGRPLNDGHYSHQCGDCGQLYLEDYDAPPYRCPDCQKLYG